MNSNFSLLFLALQARIDTIVDSDNNKIFRTVDHDLGYLDEDIPPVNCPAVLIDMNSFKFSDMASNCQIAEGTVVFKIIFMPYSSTNTKTPLQWKEKGLNYYEIEEQLHQALQGWAPVYNVLVTPADPNAIPPTEDVYKDVLADVFGAFDRVNARTSNKRKDLRIREITYSIEFEDYGTKPDVIYIPVTPVITDHIVPDIDAEIESL
jgi:hypothetical protein